jgi:ABC-type uncharacterized transport system ATPase subunit
LERSARRWVWLSRTKQRDSEEFALLSAKDATRDSFLPPSMRLQKTLDAYHDDQSGITNHRRAHSMTGDPISQAPMSAPILEGRRVTLRFRGVKALSDVNFAVREGEIFSIIGANGAGKTSMMNCISGCYRPSEGALLYRGQDITQLGANERAALGIGRTFQNLALFHHMTVLDNIMVGRHHLLRNNFITGSLYWLTGARREELAHRRKVEDIIDFLDLLAVRKAVAGTLPYGLRKRVELARAMALEPNHPSRRADGRHEPRRERGHGAFYRQPE